MSNKELAHVKRWDCLTSALGRLTCALYWFNPLVWLAGWRFQVEGERACDDLVLGGGAKPSAYAKLLLEMAKEAPRWRWSATPSPSLVYPSSLKERLLAILDAGSNRAQWTRRGVVAALVFLVVAMAPVATLHPAASPSPPPTVAPPSRTAP
jgi:beta-lactamase regulating signal transducer with metallopeptidase domain